MGASQAQTDLVLAMDEGHELSGSIEFAAELFLPATAEQMARHLEVCHNHYSQWSHIHSAQLPHGWPSACSRVVLRLTPCRVMTGSIWQHRRRTRLPRGRPGHHGARGAPPGDAAHIQPSAAGPRRGRIRAPDHPRHAGALGSGHARSACCVIPGALLRACGHACRVHGAHLVKCGRPHFADAPCHAAPQAINALHFCAQGATLSYAELDKRANQLAHQLISLGVGLDVPVGVMLERSMELVVALLGVLKAGGAYVPMDPSYPADRLALMMEDTEV